MAIHSSSGIKKKLTPAEAFIRICRYCAFQERSHKQVRSKLFEYGLHSGEVEELISKLITDGFLNEERFARAYAGGKFRVKKWGRNKIMFRLQAHEITPRCIQKGMTEIDEGDYRKALEDILKKKFRQSGKSDLFSRRNKVAQYAIGKGYEADLVWQILKEIAPD